MFGPIEQVKTWAIIGLAIALLLAMGTAHYYHAEYKVVKAEFSGFVDKTTALGDAAKVAKLEKETRDAKQIADAQSERDAARRLLATWKAGSGGSVLSGIPASAKGVDRICFTRSGLDAALQRYTGGVESLIGEGQAAVIDSRTWYKAWPAAPPPK